MNSQFKSRVFDLLIANNTLAIPDHQGIPMSSKIKQVTDTTFDSQVLASETPVLVDYWAQWCGPCKMIGRILDESAESYAGRLSIAKINIDENPSAPSRFHVRGIPTLMLFKNGRVVATQVGAVSKSQLEAFIDAHL